jgi:spore coat protein U-like protein
MVSFERPGYSRVRLLAGSLGLGTALLLAATDGAAGATAAATMTVSATLASTCSISANPLSFGIYQPGQGSMSASTTLAVRRTRGAPFGVALNAGTGGGTVTQGYSDTIVVTVNY